GDSNRVLPTEPSVLTVGRGTTPTGSLAPEARTHAFEFDDLGVVDEQVHVRPEVLDVPLEHVRTGSLEDEVLFAELVGDLVGNVRAPFEDFFSNSFGLDHQEVRTGVEMAFALADGHLGVLLAFFQILGVGGTARAELDVDLGFRLDTID